MMTIARKPNTYQAKVGAPHFYNIFYLDDSSYDDIRRRLESMDLLWKRVMLDADGAEILIFGETAFKKQPTGF